MQKISRVMVIFSSSILFALPGLASEGCIFKKDVRTVHIPQTHWRPEFKGNAMIKDAVGRSQYDIAKTILENSDRAIFVESLYENLTPSYYQSGAKGMVQAAKVIFPEGKIPPFDKMSDIQKKLLTEEGAPSTLFYLGQIKEIHKTYKSQEQSDEIDQKIQKLSAKTGSLERGIGENPEVIHLMMSEREKAAVAEISQYQNENPKGKVFLIYGAAHEYDKYYLKDFEKAKCKKMTQDCGEAIAGTGLDSILTKSEKGYSINHSSPNLKASEKFMNTYKVRFTKSGSEERYFGNIILNEEKNISSFLVQDKNFHHVYECNKEDSSRANTPRSLRRGVQ